MTNRALGRLLFTTLLLVAILAGGLWLFATRLSRRVQKLSGAVSRAMDNGGNVPALPLTPLPAMSLASLPATMKNCSARLRNIPATCKNWRGACPMN